MAPMFHDQDIFEELLHQLPNWPPRYNKWRYMFDQMGRLVHLCLAGLQLGTVPPEVWQFSHLHTLHLAGNNLKHLPAEIGKLPELYILTVNGNHLEELPMELSQLSQLRILKMRNNSLQRFPDAICQLPRLRELDLAYNQLSYLPVELEQFSQLQKLYLAGNRLRELPAELNELPQLQVLDLKNNHLEHRPIIFDHLPHLQELWQDDEQEDWLAPYRDDDPEKEVERYLPYIAVIYKLFFPGDVAIANQRGMLPIPWSGMGDTCSGFPDIADVQRQLIWETRGGEEALDPDDVLEGMHQAQLHVHAITTQDFLFVGGWKIGTIAQPERQIQRNDFPTRSFARLYDGPHVFDFTNGGQITLGVAAPGVLGYTWRKGTPRLNSNDIPVLAKIPHRN